MRERRRLPDRAGSANTIAKLAHGLADNLLDATALAARCPLIVAPAMNDPMWEHPATQANVALLRERGVEVLEPGTGRPGDRTASGASGACPSRARCCAAVEAPRRVRGDARRRSWRGCACS